MAGHHRFRAPPQAYEFNERDQRTFARWYWRCPQRLVLAGVWRELWRADDAKRGGGLASAVLPVLALHHFKPESTGAAADPPKPNANWRDAFRSRSAAPPATPAGRLSASALPRVGWTEWSQADAHHALSHRRIAALAGIDKTSVASALQQLETRGLIQSRRVAPPAHTGGAERQVYRLNLALFPVNTDEWYTEIGGTLLYGGMWSMLPTHAARHLYVVIAALDAVANETAFLSASDHYGRDWDDEERAEILADFRYKHPLSISDLTFYAGFTSTTTTESALKILTTPVTFRNKTEQRTVPLVERGEAKGRMSWFAPSREAATVQWSPAVLNSAERRNAERRQVFPSFAMQRLRRSARPSSPRPNQARPRAKTPANPSPQTEPDWWSDEHLPF